MKAKENSEPLPPVWELFLQLISDSDEEFKLFESILQTQFLKLVKQMDEKSNIYDKAIEEIDEEMV
jgi:hypothetical protein